MTRTIIGWIVGAQRKFARDEDGGIIVLSLVFFVLMVMVGGMAVDLMRYENNRTALQQTLDRSILAAASIKQIREPKAVVEDYFTKDGKIEQLVEVIYKPALNSRVVSALGLVNTPTFFMHMLDVDNLQANTAGRAEESIQNVEVVLVVDVSGSMAGIKLQSLKDAASSFVDIVKEKDDLNRISIQIVPYNAQVNLGPDLIAKYKAVHQHGVPDVHCLEIPVSAYSDVTMSRILPIPMAAYADATNTTRQTNAYTSHTSTTRATPLDGELACKKNVGNFVRLPSDDPAAIKAGITGLVADGRTSITLGMKWGLTLLDPAARPMFDELQTEKKVPASFKGRPFEWDDRESKKVIVLMTDGEHVSHNKVNDDFKTGDAPIWRSTNDGRYSVQYTSGRPSRAGANEYYVPHLNAWQAVKYDGGSGTTRMTWQGMWERQRVSWVAWQLYARALGDDSNRVTLYDTAMNAMRSTFETVENMDTQLQKSCSLAKERDVVVYGIAFEAPTEGAAQIRNCASSVANHYFAAQGDELTEAFKTIAADIIHLRLTQ